MSAAPLQAPHRSLVGKRAEPKGLASTRLPDDVRVLVEEEALDIFTRMSNAGQPLAKTLAAIYLSGMSAAAHAAEEPGEPVATVVVSVRMTAPQRERFNALGGSAWVRSLLDAEETREIRAGDGPRPPGA